MAALYSSAADGDPPPELTRLPPELKLLRAGTPPRPAAAARGRLSAPLPAALMPRRERPAAARTEWAEHWSDEHDQPYWTSLRTGQSTWSRPSQVLPAVPGWVSLYQF